MIVVDASAIGARVLRTARADALDVHDDLHAPELCDLEIASALRRGLVEGELSPERVSHALADYLRLPLTLHGHRPLVRRCLTLFGNFTPYDASYVALAEVLRAPLLTLDSRFARAVADFTDVELAPA